MSGLQIFDWYHVAISHYLRLILHEREMLFTLQIRSSINRGPRKVGYSRLHLAYKSTCSCFPDFINDGNAPEPTNVKSQYHKHDSFRHQIKPELHPGVWNTVKWDSLALNKKQGQFARIIFLFR